jgi:hypothetical protein
LVELLYALLPAAFAVSMVGLADNDRQRAGDERDPADGGEYPTQCLMLEEGTVTS